MREGLRIVKVTIRCPLKPRNGRWKWYCRKGTNVHWILKYPINLYSVSVRIHSQCMKIICGYLSATKARREKVCLGIWMIYLISAFELYLIVNLATNVVFTIWDRLPKRSFIIIHVRIGDKRIALMAGSLFK